MNAVFTSAEAFGVLSFETFFPRLGHLSLVDVVEEVHDLAARGVGGEDRGGVALLRRQVERADVDLDDELLAQARRR